MHYKYYKYSKMKNIEEKITIINKVICDNIYNVKRDGRGLVAQNILSQLRNLLDAISLFFYSKSINSNVDETYDNIKRANSFVSSQGRLKIISNFYSLLQMSTSHYTFNEDHSERLILKYYEYLIRLKELMKENNVEILQNIKHLPLNIDKTTKQYYEKIAHKLNNTVNELIKNDKSEVYYIHKIKPFFIEQQIYYEVTFNIANDYASKFDRITAFTKLDILPNYAVKLFMQNARIEVLGKEIKANLIYDWEVSIRGCEINHFADLFGTHSKISPSIKEYKLLMDFLKYNNINLYELVQFDDYYNEIKQAVLDKANTQHIFNILDKCRHIIKNNEKGCNIIRYLLYSFNNKIIKSQKSDSSCNKLDNLFLNFKTIPFDTIPFNTSLVNHNPKLYDLFKCIDITDREYELFARGIKNNTEQGIGIYTSIKEHPEFENIESFISQYNDKLYEKHKPSRELKKFYEHVYIHEYESNVKEIIEQLNSFSARGIEEYSVHKKNYLSKYDDKIDDTIKKECLVNMFNNSSIAIIYGAAGTGKSTLINHISNIFSDKSKIYLTNSNTAIDNLREKIDNHNTRFMTIAKFLSNNNVNSKCDILFIDECSTVSNANMLEIIKKAKFDLLVLVGDIYQIESIIFGNWFNLAKSFISSNSIFELTETYRTKDTNLLNFWNSVRKLEPNIKEKMIKNGYCSILDNNIFNKISNDEIILSLNYDGIYGINNINKLLQASNNNKEVSWAGKIYKVDDPILFNETKRFSPVIYNNLKGTIVGIEKQENRIYFDIKIDKEITKTDSENSNLELIECHDTKKSIVRFFVNIYDTYDEDNEQDPDNVVPFQISYSISIHKAQGLEYNSVKIIITEEVDEMITHNIFYTAITRSKSNLIVFWSPETENKILSSFKEKKDTDFHILSQKYPNLKV